MSGGAEGDFVGRPQGVRKAASAAAVALALLCAAPGAALAGAAAACESVPPLNSLEMTQPLNLGELKQQIRHYACSGAYDSEVAKVASEAQAYVEKRAGEVAKPALVLDIDETSLSNFREILANDFGYIYDGACDVLPKGPCGWRAWLLSARAEAIAPTLALFKAARAKGVAVFFITGRRDDDEQRNATVKNLTDAGYEGWSGLSLRPKADQDASVVPYKSGERAKIAAQGYTIIANSGDQHSDLAGGYAERAWKLPNPFYFIP
jgi:acid phosphatase